MKREMAKRMMAVLAVMILALMVPPMSATAIEFSDPMYDLPWGKSIFDYMDSVNDYNGMYNHQYIVDWDAFTEIKEGHYTSISTRSTEPIGWVFVSYKESRSEVNKVFGVEYDMLAARFLPSVENEKVVDDVYSSRLYMLDYKFRYCDDFDATAEVILSEITKRYGEPTHIVAHEQTFGSRIDRYTVIGNNGIRLILEKSSNREGTFDVALYLGCDGVDEEINRIYEIAGVEYKK